MAAEQGDRCSSIEVPLLVDEKVYQVNDSKNKDEYHMVHVGNASSFKTCFHLVNAISGVGIVSIPYALASGGWLSILLLFTIAIACCYTGTLVKKCMDMDLNIRTFPDIGQHAFGSKGRLMVSIIMNSELYLAVTGFLILEGDNLNKLVPNVQIHLAGLTIGGTTMFTMVTALVILPTVLLEDMSLLSYVSAGGALASSIFIVSLLWNGAIDGTGFHGKGRVFRWSGIPSAVSLFAFCYSAHPILPTLYNSMRDKSRFYSVLSASFLACTFGYAAAAILGYLMFGEEVESQVTLNLQTGKLSSRVAIYTTLVNPIAKYALMLTPVINAIKMKVSCNYYNKRVTHMIISTSLLVGSLTIAVTIPLFGYLMSLVGALLSVSASILVPSICYLKISGSYKRFGCEMVINYSIIVMGVAIAVFGTYRSLVDIIQNL
ncbi:putative amino acid transporter, transmembrane domain-containing protein [Medicago truncatula]|uniref:Putative amino acid transporter, transmembrane domain-containing protein n=1 Tax=Medicago truncatula TaxID=3880 RepID=A0A072UYA2_MEDTR|nr:amino acid transporter AVT1I [Medicago truncatula]KEH34376.1 transmembrane amino acid transporter family protein [Medicago truncatula]RHN67730.1 putative amino acid transporter, transmembrane domain-containing protein [Medicago truncatula]